jgi:hypothetical protein
VVALLNPAHAPAPDHEAVLFTPPQLLHRCSNAELVGQVDKTTGEILSRLAADDELQLQLTLSTSSVATESSAKPVATPLRFLGITIYGPRSRLNDVGDFISQCRCYLEDPFACDRNVPYMNPQCLVTLHRRPQMTFDLPQAQLQTITGFTQTSADVLKDFETTDCFEEAANPPALKTTLQAYVLTMPTKDFANITLDRHQLQALTFFRRRDQGLHPTRDGIDIWPCRMVGNKPRYDYARGGRALYVLITILSSFINPITKKECSTPGPVWRGGLLADEMGLGKTLSMIALIASDLESKNRITIYDETIHAKKLSSTLVVLPLSCENNCPNLLV